MPLNIRMRVRSKGVVPVSCSSSTCTAAIAASLRINIPNNLYPSTKVDIWGALINNDVVAFADGDGLEKILTQGRAMVSHAPLALVYFLEGHVKGALVDTKSY